MSTLLSHTEYHNGCMPLHREDKFSTRREARAELARIVRDCRRDLNTVVLRDAPGVFYITNVLGPCVFERSLEVLT